MKKTVEDALRAALKSLGVEPPGYIEVSVPREEAHGDLSTPIAMGLAKEMRKPPRKIAEEIAARLPEAGAFEKAEIAGPGFINFFFRTEFLHSLLSELLRKGRDFLRTDIGRGRRVLVEFVSANPTGPLHLGHGRGAAVGAALSNLLEAGGYKVTREYYINDAGLQVKLLGHSAFARYKELLSVEYPFPEDGYRGGYVEEIARAAAEKVGGKYREAAYEDAEEFFVGFSLAMMLHDIERDLGDFGIAFDNWQSERELYRSGEVRRALDFLKARGSIYEAQGALWFKATDFGDEKDRVLIKGDGSHTYFASDIAYHKKKIEGGYDELINIWGSDHHGYIPRMKAVLQALGYDPESLTVLLVQMVSLLRAGKPVSMSKRAGEFVTLREVMEEVGADTTKFIFLTRRPDSHLSFDLEEAKAASAENPVFYVQYAVARINSIFAHAREQGVAEGEAAGASFGPLAEDEETRIIRKLLSYPMTFESAVRSREPHRITFYLQELAGMFHPYYNRHRVVTGDRALTLARLSLCQAVMEVLKDGLEVLGVAAPERM
ncbi:MAG: arginine--tRNA ligase [Thermodesulfovibrionales bacterium]